MSYTLIQQFNDQRAHLTFTGPFLGKTVTWDTDFYTLDEFKSHEKIANNCKKGLIEIQPLKDDIMKLTVALNITKVNKPNIEKMMIMIKQYRNLSVGRHEYG